MLPEERGCGHCSWLFWVLTAPVGQQLLGGVIHGTPPSQRSKYRAEWGRTASLVLWEGEKTLSNYWVYKHQGGGTKWKDVTSSLNWIIQLKTFTFVLLARLSNDEHVQLD